MNRWRQTKLYVCRKCPASYVHDRAYMHEVFLCPNRSHKTKVNAAIPRHTGVPAPAGATNVSGASALKCA